MELFTIENFITLIFLVILQAVLGFDNLLYISLESKRAPKDKQSFVRKIGIALAIILRMVLLFVLVNVIQLFQSPLFEINIDGIIKSTFNLHSIIVLFGGVFIMYTAIKEIFHMMIVDDLHQNNRQEQPISKIIMWIVIMNLIFSFDSILSAMALSDVFIIMASAIVIGGALMIFLADTVSVFLEKNRMYEVLGLFILFIVGIMLITEGGHLAHLYLFENEILPMSKATFYFVIFVLVMVDIVQSKYKKKLLKNKQ